MQNAGNTIPLSEEVKYFSATKAKMVAAAGPSAVNPLISRSIFLIGMGNNDLYVFGASERARNRSDAEQRRDAAALLYASLVSNYSAAVTVGSTAIASPLFFSSSPHSLFSTVACNNI